jgi:hypothetical protein
LLGEAVQPLLPASGDGHPVPGIQQLRATAAPMPPPPSVMSATGESVMVTPCVST